MLILIGKQWKIFYEVCLELQRGQVSIGKKIQKNY